MEIPRVLSGIDDARRTANYRLIGLCVLVGVLGAIAAFAFDFLVELAQKNLLVRIGGYEPPPAGVLDWDVTFPPLIERWWFPVVTTLGGLLSGIIVFSLAPEAEGHGTDAAIASYHRKGGLVRGRVPVIKAISSALTIGSGGVAGREGPTAQITVGLGALIGKHFKLRGQDRRILLLASMAGGLAAIFQAPLGMAIFAVEILYAGMIFESEALIYTVISAVVAYALHGFYAGWSPVFAIPEDLGFTHPQALLGFAVLGLLAGIMGAVLPGMFYGIRDMFAKLPGPPHLKPALGGLILGLAAMAFPELLGTGYGWVELAMAGKLSLGILLLLLLMKGPAMGLTIGSGGSGGVFGPTVVIGAMLGGVVGTGLDRLFPVLEVNIAAFVVVGMAAIFSGAARTPISTLIMVAEMTGGYGLIVPAMLTNILSFMVQRAVTKDWKYPTLYVSQVVSREDSPVHQGVFVRRALRMLDDGTVPTENLTLPKLVSLLQYGEPIPINKSDGMLVGLYVERDSVLAGKTIAESVGKIQGATAVALIRGHEMVVSRGPTMVHGGDQMIVVATSAAYAQLKELAAGAATDTAS